MEISAHRGMLADDSSGMLKMRKRRCAYRYLCPAGLVDPVHVFTELGAVAISVSVVLGHEQQGVNHFMKESLWKKKKNMGKVIQGKGMKPCVSSSLQFDAVAQNHNQGSRDTYIIMYVFQFHMDILNGKNTSPTN